MYEAYHEQAKQILNSWKEQGYMYMAVTSNTTRCYPVNQELVESFYQEGSPFIARAYTRHIPSLAGDLFYPIDSDEAGAFLVRSLVAGESYAG